ncbi:zinc finger protein 271 [Megalops cyprinoides]|uniref:zinc finger protein 271 n=1 Tax=Megalops cyprinoides TaxID=118141 RepID=UPI0018653C61|nr:zinc finger protein 271 [Megalops cyprinoides]
MDAVPIGVGAVRLQDAFGNCTTKTDSSQLAKLGAQAVQQGEKRSPKPQVPKDVFRCNECGRSFLELAALVRHQQRDHALRKPHRCYVCGQEFALLSSLQLHKRSHATLQCQLCQRSFSCTASLTNHILQQHTAVPENQGLEVWPFTCQIPCQDSGPYACALCGRAFSHKPALLHHQQAGCHTLGDKRALWPHTALPTAPHLMPQVPTPSSSAPPSFTSNPPPPTRSHLCSLCPRGFRSRAGLACHQRLRHPLEWKRAQARFWKQGGDRFPCPSCDKVFCHSLSLSQHQTRCHTKKVKRKKRRKQRHTGNLFPCRSCDMVFSQTSKLYLHRKEQHRRQEVDGERRVTVVGRKTKRRELYPCHFCNKVFSDHLSHWAHLKTHHAQKQKRMQRGKRARKSVEQVAHRQLFQCPHCDKAYRHRCNLSRHYHTHLKSSQKRNPVLKQPKDTGDDPERKEGRKGVKDDQECKIRQAQEGEESFPCSSCEEVFSQHSALSKHEEVHQTTEGMRRCSVCSHGMGSLRWAEGQVTGFYHCVPCRHVFQTLSVFLQHCQMHLFRTDE